MGVKYFFSAEEDKDDVDVDFKLIMDCLLLNKILRLCKFLLICLCFFVSLKFVSLFFLFLDKLWDSVFVEYFDLYFFLYSKRSLSIIYFIKLLYYILFYKNNRKLKTN